MKLNFWGSFDSSSFDLTLMSLWILPSCIKTNTTQKFHDVGPNTLPQVKLWRQPSRWCKFYLCVQNSIDTLTSQKATLLATEIYLLHLVKVILVFYYQFFRIWQKVNQKYPFIAASSIGGKGMTASRLPVQCTKRTLIFLH